MKYATVVPLIGGMTVGNEMATGQKPDAFFSYDTFEKNDSHARLNFPDVPFYMIDAPTNSLSENDENAVRNIGKFDFISTVCPCAGLSTLNAGNRGVDAPQNEWMYKTANFVLEKLRPRVFWGENAPALGTQSGKPVADALFEIGKKYGYSFTIVKTDTQLHGIPQRRVRTFYFFWDSMHAPILNAYANDSVTLNEFLEHAPQDALYSDKYIRDDFESNGFLQWFLSDPEHVNSFGGRSILRYVIQNEKWESLFSFLEAKGTPSELKLAKHAKFKVENGKNYWDSSPFILNTREYIPAVQGRLFQYAVHPNNQRYLSVREYMYLMGLPDSYQLSDIKLAANITQNVPTCTARDWTLEVMKYLNGELKFSDKDRNIFDNPKEAKILKEMRKNKIKAPLF